MNFLELLKQAEERASYNPEQLAMGKKVELEHGTKNPSTNITDDDPKMTEQIAKAHLNEDPKYYTKLKEMEKKGNGDEPGKPIDENLVRAWLKNNPNPEDSAVHQFAEKNGYDKHALEELVYRWASKYVKESAYQVGVQLALRQAGITP
jgi:hypothetical protein